MPPKAGPKKSAPGKPAAKKAPAAVLAKMKAQIEAQRKAEEEWQKQQEEEERKLKEEARQAELERKREEEEKKALKEVQKAEEKTKKSDKKNTKQLEALERMRAAGMIVPDVHTGERPKVQPPPKKAVPKPAPKPKAQHADPSLPTWDEPKPQKVEEKKPEEKKVEADDDEVEDWEALLDDESCDDEGDSNEDTAAEGSEMAPAGSSDAVASKGVAGLAMELRSPICCVLGHVDTGKTSLLDKIRRTNVQGGEAGGITQQIGATFFPRESIETSTAELRAKYKMELKVPGLLVIDTPGHESFTNLRSRGSNLCDIAVLVVDIMHGLEPQTKESIALLRQRSCPFIIALNKVDRLFEWIPHQGMDIQQTLAKQKAHVIQEFETRVGNVMTQMAEQGFNSELYYKNKDVRTYVSIVPTSAHTGEGIPDLLMLEIQLVQKFMENKVSFKDDLQCTVLEVKPVQGFGTTIDVVLVNGTLHYGDRVVICGMQGPIVTSIRALLTPQPMKELRVKGEYVHHQEVRAAMGLKISADNLEHAVPGTPMVVVPAGADTAAAEKEVMKDFNNLLGNVSKSGEGVAVQASTLGSMEALLSFLDASKIPVSAVNLGPIHKRHLLNMVAMKEKQPKYAIVLAFDVPVTKEAQELADKNGIKIFTARIIYHLFDAFTRYVEDYEKIVKERNRSIAVFPCVLKINDKIRNKDPIIVASTVLRGQLHLGTPIITRKKGVAIGKVAGIQKDQKEVKQGKKGQDFAVKIVSSDANLTFGRQFDETDELVAAVSRTSIDALKESFRADMDEDDWKLIKVLAKEQGIVTGGQKKAPKPKPEAPTA